MGIKRAATGTTFATCERGHTLYFPPLLAHGVPDGVPARPQCDPLRACARACRASHGCERAARSRLSPLQRLQAPLLHRHTQTDSTQHDCMLPPADHPLSHPRPDFSRARSHPSHCHAWRIARQCNTRAAWKMAPREHACARPYVFAPSPRCLGRGWHHTRHVTRPAAKAGCAAASPPAASKQQHAQCKVSTRTASPASTSPPPLWPPQPHTHTPRPAPLLGTATPP